MLALTGCEKVEQEQLTVYSFSGENEQLSISNGIIILNGTEETFSGGDLKVSDYFFDNITSYSTTFYIMAGDEKDVILSNGMVDMTGDTVNVSGDLGQILEDSAIRGCSHNEECIINQARNIFQKNKARLTEKP